MPQFRGNSTLYGFAAGWFQARRGYAFEKSPDWFQALENFGYKRTCLAFIFQFVDSQENVIVALHQLQVFVLTTPDEQEAQQAWREKPPTGRQ